MNIHKFLADHNLSRGDFTTEHVLVTREGFKLGESWNIATSDHTKNNLVNIYLYKAVKANTNIRDLRSVRQILREVLIRKSCVLENVE